MWQVSHWNSWSMGLVAFVVGVAWAAPGAARAEHPPELVKFAGSYSFAGSDAEGMAIIDKAIEDAVSQMNKIKALVIQKLISGNKRFIRSIQIELPSDKIKIKLDELDVEAKPGETKTVEGRGGSAEVTLRFRNGALEQVLKSDRGAFTSVYRLAQGGKVLERDVTVTDKWLDKPVRYRLVYKRR